MFKDIDAQVHFVLGHKKTAGVIAFQSKNIWICLFFLFIKSANKSFLLQDADDVYEFIDEWV